MPNELIYEVHPKKLRHKYEKKISLCEYLYLIICACWNHTD